VRPEDFAFFRARLHMQPQHPAFGAAPIPGQGV
jgi:hypothetical protein